MTPVVDPLLGISGGSETKDSAVLAFNDPWHDSSFCIYGPSRLVHVEVERFSRVKYETQNPLIAFCALFPDEVEGFDHIAIEEGYFLAPLIRRLVSVTDLVSGASGFRDLIIAATAPQVRQDGIAPRAITACDESVERFCSHLAKRRPTIHFCGHHESHAANAFYSSGFASALTITLDGGGVDWVQNDDGSPSRAEVYGTVYDCADGRIRRRSCLREESFGLAWSRITSAIGLGWGEEGTVMAMAALGDPARFRSVFEAPHFWLPHVPWLDARAAAALGNHTAQVTSALRTDQDRFDLAAALQAATEQRVKAFLGQHIDDQVETLCVAGGLFLNCQLLGRVHRWFPRLRRVYIPPAPYDGGVSVGAAQCVRHDTLGVPSRSASGRIASFAMGRLYSREEILAACQARDLPISRVRDEEIVERLINGQIGGLFGGAAESGRRALGHRSIIADPRRAEMKDRINAIKRRQWFRPVAPMVLAEEAHRWFDVSEYFESPYMSFAVPARHGCVDRVPAVLHLDGSARVQTVHRDLSPTLHRLLSSWFSRTGTPILVNTSFNDSEPIVETPDDALDTFGRTRMDFVYFIDHGMVVVRTRQA